MLEVNQVQHLQLVTLGLQATTSIGQDVALSIRDHVVGICLQNIGLNKRVGFTGPTGTHH